eukprot:3511588-Karenia_brevis.AAC.1
MVAPCNASPGTCGSPGLCTPVSRTDTHRRRSVQSIALPMPIDRLSEQSSGAVPVSLRVIRAL